MKYYITDISSDGKSGKEKATREKIKVLLSFENFKLFKIKRPNKNGFFEKIFFDLKLSYCLLKIDKNSLLVERLTWGLFSLMIIKIRQIRLISEIHADALEENNLIRSGSAKYLYFTLLKFREKLMPIRNGYILNHPSLVKIIDQKKPYLISYNGISKEDLNYNLNSKKKPISIPKKILFIGSGAIWHGLEKLVDSWDKANILNWELHVVGDISLKKENIVIHGRKYGADLKSIIKDCDAFILPVDNVRLSPGSPLKLYEYLSYNKPILTFEEIGYSDELEKYGFGFSGNLFDPSVLKSLLNKLEKNNYFENISVKNNINEITWNSRLKKWNKWIDKNFH